MCIGTNMGGNTVFLVVMVFVCLLPTALGEKRVCYIKDDAFYYQGVPAYQKHFINESLCSHIVFSRALIRNNSIYFREHRTGERLDNIISTYANSKVLLEIEIRDVDLVNTMDFSVMAQSIRQYSIARKLAGISLHFPNRPADARFMDLYKTFHNRFNTLDGTKNLILVLKAYATMSTDYNVTEFSRLSDFIMLETYLFNGTEVAQATVVAPLEDVIRTANAWTDEGVPKDKLVLGMATFGRYLKLKVRVGELGSPVQNTVYGLTFQKGIISFYEICSLLDSNPQRSTHGEPYFTPANSNWVGYEDTTSLMIKRHWISANGYGGWMADTHLDDYSGQYCDQGSYPLIKALNVPTVEVSGNPAPDTNTTRIPASVEPSQTISSEGSYTSGEVQTSLTNLKPLQTTKPKLDAPAHLPSQSLSSSVLNPTQSIATTTSMPINPTTTSSLLQNAATTMAVQPTATVALVQPTMSSAMAPMDTHLLNPSPTYMPHSTLADSQNSPELAPSNSLIPAPTMAFESSTMLNLTPELNPSSSSTKSKVASSLETSSTTSINVISASESTMSSTIKSQPAPESTSSVPINPTPTVRSASSAMEIPTLESSFSTMESSTSTQSTSSVAAASTNTVASTMVNVTPAENPGPTCLTGVELDCEHGVHYCKVNNCTEFFHCSSSVLVLKKCNFGLYFNPAIDACDWPYNVERCSKP